MGQIRMIGTNHSVRVVATVIQRPTGTTRTAFAPNLHEPRWEPHQSPDGQLNNDRDSQLRHRALSWLQQFERRSNREAGQKSKGNQPPALKSRSVEERAAWMRSASSSHMLR
jgi:hypothetical protein